MRISRAALLLAALLQRPTAGAAQQGFLDQAENKIATGALGDARSLLQRWRGENASAARSNSEQQARYHYLLARTTMNADSAQDNYLIVALNYPTSKAAPAALLRLAQARAARMDTAQAISYLQRLVTDYPKSEERPLAGDWVARLQAGAPNRRTTAAEVRKRSAETKPPPLQPAPKPIAATAKPDSTRNVDSPAGTLGGNTAARAVAIQVGAFRELSGARSMKLQLERAGFTDVRLVRVPGNTLIRVRIGKYNHRSAAAPMVAQLAQKNFGAVLVTDLANESSVMN